MSLNPIKAFVSSTYEDLKKHRTYVIKALRKAGIFVDPMEDWTSESDRPKVFSQDRVNECHFFVLLVAFRRGYVPENETKSVTQLEYQEAIRLKIDILAYLLRENVSWPPQFDERNTDPAVHTWRTQLGETHGRELFGPTPSSIDISPAITRWFVKHTNPVVADLSGLASKLIDHEAVLRHRKTEVISYLEKVRDLIQHAHDELARNRVPHGTCQQIFDTGSLLMRAIGKDLSGEDLDRLQNILRSAHEIRALHEALKNESDRLVNLAELDRTRGLFAALVETIRVSPQRA